MSAGSCDGGVNLDRMFPGGCGAFDAAFNDGIAHRFSSNVVLFCAVVLVVGPEITYDHTTTHGLPSYIPPPAASPPRACVLLLLCHHDDVMMMMIIPGLFFVKSETAAHPGEIITERDSSQSGVLHSTALQEINRSWL